MKTETKKKDGAESYINMMERFTSSQNGYFLKCFDIQDPSDSKQIVNKDPLPQKP